MRGDVVQPGGKGGRGGMGGGEKWVRVRGVEIAIEFLGLGRGEPLGTGLRLIEKVLLSFPLTMMDEGANAGVSLGFTGVEGRFKTGFRRTEKILPPCAFSSLLPISGCVLISKLAGGRSRRWANLV